MSIIVIAFDILLMSLYGLFGIYEIPLVLSYVLSAFTIVVITNAYSLIDRIDGPDGFVDIICCLCLSQRYFYPAAYR
ncbi:MAG: UDP-GlcNAc:undecaprenyl-phosphate GlcNAc-1-phosphate transferase [Arcticibacterium sp.]|jgi:UDP-GlcNAc:undecaprenyl-phosphate GlcNAc-1-phosphate transferase